MVLHPSRKGGEKTLGWCRADARVCANQRATRRAASLERKPTPRPGLDSPCQITRAAAGRAWRSEKGTVTPWATHPLWAAPRHFRGFLLVRLDADCCKPRLACSRACLTLLSKQQMVMRFFSPSVSERGPRERDSRSKKAGVGQGSKRSRKNGRTRLSCGPQGAETPPCNARRRRLRPTRGSVKKKKRKNAGRGREKGSCRAPGPEAPSP
jgi:hypothetical protein